MPKLYSEELKEEVRRARSGGRTHREIAADFSLNTSTVFEWTKGIVMSPSQEQDIKVRKMEKMYTPSLRKKLSDYARVRLAPYHQQKHSREDRIERIRSFVKEHGRIPLKKEFNDYAGYKKCFGSWNNAIETAGFKPNDLWFTHQYLADDGHICDSFSEKIIDDWLNAHDVVHERSIPYGISKMTADFFLPTQNVFIEFFGLAGSLDGYDKVLARKRILAKELGMNIVELFPKDLKSVTCSERVLRSIITPSI